MYDAHQLRDAYMQLEHGKTRLEGMRYAASEADKNNDISFRLFFRLEQCSESTFFGDSLDMFVVFPEVLAIIDEHPDAAVTQYDSVYTCEMEHVMWVYKWVIDNTSEFYQIPLEDCKKYFEDFKRRTLQLGYSLRPYYQYLYNFYEDIAPQKAKKYFHKREMLPYSYEGNCDCRACERNWAISFYLKHDNMERAKKLAEDIESFRLTCGADSDNAWLRLRNHYGEYYMRHREYEKAAKCYDQIREHNSDYAEFQNWDEAIICYAHLDMGKALQLYKEFWREWVNMRNPSDNYFACINLCAFFRMLGNTRETVKLDFDRTFPCFRADHEYQIDKLYDFYYEQGRVLADKFDARNGIEWYRTNLDEQIQYKVAFSDRKWYI